MFWSFLCVIPLLSPKNGCPQMHVPSRSPLEHQQPSFRPCRQTSPGRFSAQRQGLSVSGPLNNSMHPPAKLPAMHQVCATRAREEIHPLHVLSNSLWKKKKKNLYTTATGGAKTCTKQRRTQVRNSRRRRSLGSDSLYGCGGLGREGQ